MCTYLIFWIEIQIDPFQLDKFELWQSRHQKIHFPQVQGDVPPIIF